MADNIIKGKACKAGMSLHKLTYQALWRILIPQMFAFCQTQYTDLHHDLIKLSMGELKDSSLSLLCGSQQRCGQW